MLDARIFRMSIAKWIWCITISFLVPIAHLTDLYISQVAGDSSFAQKETAGTQYLAQIWPSFAAAAIANGPSQTEIAGQTDFDSQFGTAAASKAFLQANER